MKQITLQEKYLTRARPTASADLTKDQRHAVGYFFVRLKSVDPVQYDVLMPDEKTEAVIKREFAHYISKYTPAQIDLGMARLHKLRQDNDKDYRFLNIDKTIGLIKNDDKAGAPAAGTYKILHRSQLLPEPEEHKAKRKEQGIKHTKRLLGMFDD